ncbi:MAG: hypothetical protein CMD39_00120 [Gammaproteobacteria bacterium]|nr:hypothetical protein [Gammaproteobacteria bacterium]
MNRDTAASVIDQLVSSYFELPVHVDWERASGMPFPDRFDHASLRFQGLATAWMDLKQVVWRAAHVRFVPGMPATIRVSSPQVEIAVGKDEITRWLQRFELPYRVELSDDAIVLHTELAGLPVAELEARLEVIGGWFVLQPRRASVLGVPNYVAALFRTYLPLPPLAGNTRLASIQHEPDVLRLTFSLEDFEEQVTPGLLARLQKRLLPTLEMPFANALSRRRPVRPLGG